MLAPELVDQIIDYLAYDVKSLRTCALISRDWTSRARYHLFKQLSVNVVRQWSLYYLLARSDLFLSNLVPLHTAVRDFTFTATPRKKAQASNAQNIANSFSISIHSIFQLVHSFPFLRNLKLCSVGIFCPEPLWFPDDLPVPLLSLDHLELASSSSSPEDLLRVLNMFSWIGDLRLNGHAVDWFPDRRALSGALQHPVFSTPLPPQSLQVSRLCLKRSVAWNAAPCIHVGPSLGLQALQVVPRDLPADLEAVGALLLKCGSTLQTLDIFLELMLARNGSHTMATSPCLDYSHCKALHTITLSGLFVNHDFSFPSFFVASYFRMILEKPAPAVTVVVIALRYVSGSGPAHISGRDPYWSKIEEALQNWPSLRGVCVKAVTTGHDSVASVEKITLAVESRLPLLRTQKRLQVVVHRQQ